MKLSNFLDVIPKETELMVLNMLKPENSGTLQMPVVSVAYKSVKEVREELKCNKYLVLYVAAIEEDRMVVGIMQKDSKR